MTVATLPGKLHLGRRNLERIRSAVLVSHPLLVLGLSASLSFTVYLFFLARPLNLFEYLPQGRLDGVYIYRDKPFNQVRLLVTFLLLSGLYLWGWLAAKKAQGWRAWLLTGGGALACGVALLFMAPFDAADIYDNIVHARILGIYGGNPYLQTGKDYRSDPFFRYMAWKASPSAYGPAWEYPAAVTARLAGDNLVANVLAFKILPGFFWLVSLGLVAVYLSRVAPREALGGVYLLAWNPTVLYSTWGNGHNDISMMLWILLATWMLARRHYSAAFLSILGGALVKYIPLLILPAAGWIIWNELGSQRQRVRFTLLAAIASLALIWLAYSPIWVGPQTLSIERRTQLFTSSIPAIISHLFNQGGNQTLAEHVISLVAAAITGAFALWRGWRARLEGAPEALPRAGFDILTFYLLLTCLWFQQWYTTWLVGLAAVLSPDYRRRFAIFFSLAALSKQLLAGPLLFRPRPILPQPELEMAFTLGVLGLPWLYWLASYWTSRRSASYRTIPGQEIRS
jgi:hypothetical protein